MSERIAIGPLQSLVETVADVLLSGGDLSSSIVVFPGKRPAHFLRKALARRLGRSYIPPRIVSMDDFISFLWDRSGYPARKELGRLDAAAMLFEVHSGMKERIGGEAFSSLESFLPLGFTVFDELEELRMSMKPERDIRNAISGLAIDRAYLLPEYDSRLYARCIERSTITRASKYAAVASSPERAVLDPGCRVVLAGLFKLTEAERMVVEHLARLPETVQIFQDHTLAETEPGPAVEFVRATDIHGQVFAVAEDLRRRVEGGETPDESSVIVLPDASALFPLVQNALAVLPQDGYNVALGYPVARTPVAGFIDALFSVLTSLRDGRVSARAYVRFLLHPYVKNFRFGMRTDVPRILAHALERFLIEERSLSSVSLETIETAEHIFEATAWSVSSDDAEVTAGEIRRHLRTIHDLLLRPCCEVASVGDVASKLIGVLNVVAGRTTAHLHPLFRSNVEAVVAALHELRESLLANASFSSMDAYERLIREHLSTPTVPFPGTPLHGLQVLGLLETRGLRFDHVTILSMNDDVLPGGEGADALLPQAVRQALHLETLRDRDELIGHHVGVLLNGAKRVTICYAEGDGTRRSRYAEKLLWAREQSGKPVEIRTVQYAVRVANGRVASVAKTPEVMRFLKSFSYSATSLNEYLRCGLKFYYSHALRLREKEEVDEDVDASTIGTVVHEILKEYFSSRIGLPLTPDLLDESRMEQIAGTVFGRTFGDGTSAGMFLMREQVQRHLAAFISGYQRPLVEADRVTITDLEREVKATFSGCSLYGKIDRVERRGDRIMILDYKTGAMPKTGGIRFQKLDVDDAKTWSDAVESLQLPVYRLLYSQIEGAERERVIPAFVCIGANRLDSEIEMEFDEPGGEVPPVSERLLTNILRQINDPATPFLPPEDVLATCRGCSFQHICGTQWVGR